MMNKLTILGILIWVGLAMVLKFAKYILKKKLDCYEGFCGINHGQKNEIWKQLFKGI